MGRLFPSVRFERYADDVVVHRVTERQARHLLAAITRRLADVGLRPDKAKIVYCKDDNRRGSFEHTSFTFVGYMFCRRTARTRRGVLFTGVAPAISPAALKAISREVGR